MKLDETRPYLETSGEMEEQFFSIQDQGMIFDILRNKMYSNPILAICREISCNARDAQREVGASDIPIHIHLPNNLEPYYKVKDFGPGISPDRMSNIFIKYTASTKRDDNVQTGGFGLGAKTPFSYSDSFSIITNHNGVQYNYSCNIDETKVGKLMLMSESPTKEKNGTEIIIPVQPKNFNEFNTWTEQACRHWEVKPIIKGGTVVWQEQKKVLEGVQWAITANTSWNKNILAVIDGIEYPIDLAALRKYADAKLMDIIRGNIIMYFGVGELSLSASREQVYLDEKTQKRIGGKLKIIFDELRQNVEKRISEASNLWKANIYYRTALTTICSDVRALGTFSWNGIPLADPYAYMFLGCNVYTFTKGRYPRKLGADDSDKITRSGGAHSQSLQFEEGFELYVNDLPLKDPTPRHVKKAFDDDPKLKSLRVICPNDKVTLDILNKTCHLDKMDLKYLSSITKATRARSSTANRLLVFKFATDSCAFKQVGYSSIDEDTNTTKVLCFLTKGGYPEARQPILNNKNTLVLSSFTTFINKFPDTSFYGLDVSNIKSDRIEEDFEDFETLEDFLQEKVLANKQTDYAAIRWAMHNSYKLDHRVLKLSAKIKTLVTKTDSLYLQRLTLHEKLNQLSTQDHGLLDIYETLNGKISDTALEKFVADHPEYDIEKITTECKNRYPLLDSIQSYYYDQIIEHVVQYINLVDQT